MKLAVSALLLSALFAVPASAQMFYGATMDGASETPPLAGFGSGGWVRITKNPGNTLTYEVRTFGLSGTAAHIHKGAVGVPGGIIFPLTGGPTVWTGTTAALTPAQQADLEAGLYYVNVHTIANPNGEIRGQLGPSPRTFGAHLDNTQETPVTASAAKGDATITLNANGTLTYNLTTTGLTATAAHFHAGTFGVPGGIEVPLTGGPTNFSGTSLPLSPGQIEALQGLGWYANVHTIANPNGEIRGQIVPSGTELFNSPAAEWAPMLTMTSSGAPTDVGGGGTFTISVTGGKPGGTGLLLVALQPGASKISNVPFLLNAG